VLVIDDFGMRELTAAQADDLYELITERAGCSLILTSNRAPATLCRREPSGQSSPHVPAGPDAGTSPVAPFVGVPADDGKNPRMTTRAEQEFLAAKEQQCVCGMLSWATSMLTCGCGATRS
jgi:hypothetical protein